MDGESRSPMCDCKVGSLLKKYDLPELNDKLIAKWIGENGEPEGVRSLQDWFNRRLLEAEMHNSSMNVVQGSVKNFYDLLTSDDHLEAARMQARDALTREGVDVNRVKKDFVSHQTIYRHLTNCLNAEKQKTSPSIEDERVRISALQSRTETVATDALNRLGNADKISLSEFNVLVPIRVTCEACGSHFDLSNLLDQGGCDCVK